MTKGTSSMGKWMDGYLEKLANVKEANIKGGGEDRAALMSQLGKLTARERIDKLLDKGSFEEIGSAVTDTRPSFDGKDRLSPSDGVVMGFGEVDGRSVMLYSIDYTVMSGAIGDQAVWKLADLVKMAGQNRMPIIGMIDSAGERISFKEGDVGFYGMSQFVRNLCLYSGVVPRITLLLGPCTGVMATVPVLSDFLIINENT